MFTSIAYSNDFKLEKKQKNGKQNGKHMENQKAKLQNFNSTITRDSGQVNPNFHSQGLVYRLKSIARRRRCARTFQYCYAALCATIVLVAFTASWTIPEDGKKRDKHGKIDDELLMN